MSFSLELTSGAIRSLYCQQTLVNPKPFLQVTCIEKIESLKSHNISERFKLLLSDGIHFMKAVLSPKLNQLIHSNCLKSNIIIKLLEYDVHIIKGKPLLVVLKLEEIFHCPSILGSPISVEQIHARQERIYQSFSTDFLLLFNNPQFSDVSFVLKDRSCCYAHKNILMCRSPYFRCLLTNGMKETFQSQFEVSDFEPEIFLIVLKFIYSDQIYFNPAMTIEKIWDVIIAARYYGLDRLDKLCQQYLVGEKLSVDTVVTLWNQSCQVSAIHVSNACQRFLEEHLQQVLQLETFGLLEKSLFMQLLNSNTLQVSNQEILIQAILKWSKSQTLEEEWTKEAKHDLFCKFFSILRKRSKQITATMSPKEAIAVSVIIPSFFYSLCQTFS